MLPILALVFSGLFARGILFLIASHKPNSTFSIVKTTDTTENRIKNKLSAKAYMFVGGVYFCFMVLAMLLYPNFFSNNFLLLLGVTFLLDIILFSLVSARVEYEEMPNNKNDN